MVRFVRVARCVSVVRFVRLVVVTLVFVSGWPLLGREWCGAAGVSAASAVSAAAIETIAWQDARDAQDAQERQDASARARSRSPQSPAANGSAKGTVVNLNTASAAELEALPGIGASTAARIIEYREKNGSFKKIEDLMNVRGIGEKSFLKLKPLITVTPVKADRGAGAAHG